MSQTNLTPQTKEIISRLYSSNEYNKREAIYRILFDRRTDLVPELKKAVKYEKNETIAVFMVQVCLTLTNFPRDAVMERRIIEILQYEEGGKVNDITPTMWEYLENCATSQMIIAILASMGNSIPANSYDFIEMCLTHPDPEVRCMVCEKAIKSGRPSHFAYVLNLVADKDPIVSQTAFLAIKNLPEAELAIILDYALGSPDEWVLKTVAPFLPNLITNSLRSVIAKVQYHSNQLVAHKAREALKVLDAIPYITKRSMKDHDEAEKRKEEEKEKKEEFVIENGKKVSLKEQLEQKRKEQEEKDRAIKEANDALDRELSEIKDSDMADFAKSLDNYDKVLPEEGITVDDSNELPEEKTFTENTDFSLEADALAEIDENTAEKAVSDIVTDEKAFLDAIESVKKKDEEEASNNEPSAVSAPEEAKVIEEPAQEGIKQEEPKAEIQPKPEMTAEKTASEPVSEDNTSSQLSLDLSNEPAAIQETDGLSLDLSNEPTAVQGTDSLSLDLSNESAAVQETDSLNLDLENSAQFLDAEGLDLGIATQNQENNSADPLNISESELNLDLDMPEINVENIDLTAIDLTSEAQEINKPSPQPKPKAEVNPPKEATNPPKTPVNPISEKLNSAAKASPKPAASKESVPASAKDIFEKYPSFIVDPLLEIYKASTDEARLKAIDQVLNNLTAFLNICFLQSAMYFAQESEMLTKSIKDCIKGNLIGPSAIRCLHNFVLAMKAVRGNNIFFTFPLSKVMSSSDETNPLMLMRELKEFLKEPEEPLNESVPQAIEGLLEILRGVRYITNNTLVMRAPQGAKLPYADLSGPTAKPLDKDKRPSMDLPVGEVILISTDGSEAFGMFPFFKYSKKKVIFTIPTSEELATFYERLEITP